LAPFTFSWDGNLAWVSGIELLADLLEVHVRNLADNVVQASACGTPFNVIIQAGQETACSCKHQCPAGSGGCERSTGIHAAIST